MRRTQLVILAAVLATCISTAAALDFTVEWQVNHEDKQLRSVHHSSPNVYDLDGDGANEIVFCYRKDVDRMACFNADGSTKWFYPPLGEDPLGGDVLAKPTIVDINNDGTVEILIGSRDRHVYCISNMGSLLWKYGPTGASIEDTPEAFDVDGDGDMEIFFPEDDRHIYSIDHTGNLLWISPEAGSFFEGHPTAVDVDSDGEVEVIALCGDSNAYCYSALTGQEEWRFPTGAKFQSNTAVVADVNNDGEYEILASNDEGRLYCISFYGTELWHWEAYTMPGDEMFRFEFPVGDIDNDGHLEAVLMSNYMVYCVDCFTGATKWDFKPYYPAHWGNYHLLADVTGDGEVDVLVLAPLLYVLDNKGNVQAKFPTQNLVMNDRAESGMWAGDVDKDGVTEILFKYEGDDFYCVTLGGAYDASNMPWPQMQYNSQNRVVIEMSELLYLSPLLLGCLVALRRRR
jgi:outer membrane protein assembly factor BamB